MTVLVDIPPSYSTATTTTTSPPSYSFEPLADEEIVAFTPRLGVSPPHGKFTKEWSQATLILKDQEDNVRLPSYGRGGRIIGELGLANTDKIIRVVVKLTGHMSLSVADSGTTGIPLICIGETVWQQPEGSTSDARCPSLIPFHIQFPHGYEYEGKHWRLPPSFEATFLGVPAMFVRCTYTFSVTITRMRSYHLAHWTTNKTYVTLVNYRPRTRPHRPIVLLDSVFESIKPVPDEWFQVMATMNVHPNSNMRPIECHLFVPSTQTYAITDSIPVHLQLCSSLQSIRELLPPTSSLLHPQPPDFPRPTDVLRPEAFAIRLSIARQIVVEVNGRRRFRTFVLGMGKLYPIPPARDDENGASADTDVSLDWQGEVKCWKEVTTGGFSASSLLVKDFLILSLTPPNARTSPLIPLQVSHPIRLVTDAWSETSGVHPLDL